MYETEAVLVADGIYAAADGWLAAAPVAAAAAAASLPSRLIIEKTFCAT